MRSLLRHGLAQMGVWDWVLFGGLLAVLIFCVWYLMQDPGEDRQWLPEQEDEEDEP